MIWRKKQDSEQKDIITAKENSSGENSLELEEEAIAEKTQKVMVDKKRQLTGATLMIVNIICFSMTLFQLYAAGPGNLVANALRAIHLGYGLCLVFLLYPICSKASRDRIQFYDIVLAAGGMVANLYLVVNMEVLASRAGLMTGMDLIMGLILIITLLEAARRIVGPVLTGIAGFFLIYTLFGQYFPGIIAHRGVALSNLVRHMYLTLEGVYGVALGVSASFIFLFITMGAILTHMGTGQYLTDMAICAFGRQRGGPAKAAVVSSSLFGLISGSTIANICTTGTFTIPLMKKTGYKPYFAGSVESAASVGGQIMPPIMGAAAFIIAENLGVSYLTVCLAAAFPALLYFSGIFFAVHQEAVKSGIKGLSEEDIPDIKKVARNTYLVLPLIVIIVLLIMGFSPAMAGVWAVVVAIALSWLRKETRMTPVKLFYAFADGAKNALEVLVACAVVGFIVGSFTLSGMGLRLATLVVAVGDGKLLPTLILTAVACLILGMGVPTTANYVMMSMITAPALLMMGVDPMAAHLFCFYFGIISDLTPPVALGALAGAGLAGARFWPTAINSSKLAVAAYLGPFFFVYHPVLLIGQQPFEAVHILYFVFAFGGLLMFSCVLYSFLLIKTRWYERIALLVSAYMTMLPELTSSFIGVAIFAGLLFLQLKRRKAQDGMAEYSGA